MALILAGIDEAGYGPLLGPLCVGLCVMKIDGWEKGSDAPNLWKTLSSAVCRDVKSTKAGRIAIADSKEIKLPNARGEELKKERHPVAHLERGVLAAIGSMCDVCVETDEALFEKLGATLPRHVCYGGSAISIPHSWTVDQQRIATAKLSRALQQKAVDFMDMRARIVSEPEFNGLVREHGSKGATTLAAVGEHLRRVFASKAVRSETDTVSVVCDRLGGREKYGSELARMLGIDLECVIPLEEMPETSRYQIRMTDAEGTRTMYVSFIVEGESRHMPIALASMIAKLTRELAMARFNRYWSNVAAELEKEIQPTAGYSQDGRRWLKDAKSMISAEDHKELVRIA